jgi:hypothetical protein
MLEPRPVPVNNRKNTEGPLDKKKKIQKSMKITGKNRKDGPKCTPPARQASV